VEIQSGEHCSIEDAQGAVRLYTMFKTQWEAHIEGINEVDNKNMLLLLNDY
jgi:hypothetical protein